MALLLVIGRNSGMSELTKHYQLLLGLDPFWSVSDVSLSLEGKSVEILVKHDGSRVLCPECGEAGSIYWPVARALAAPDLPDTAEPVPR